MKRFVYSFSGLLLAATAAHAQPAGEAPEVTSGGATGAVEAAPANPAASADSAAAAVEAAPASPAASSAVSDTDVESFAKATVKLRAIQADTSIADDQKQSAMSAAVSEAGLDPQKYNEIGARVSADEALRARVQTAMTRHAGNSDG